MIQKDKQLTVNNEIQENIPKVPSQFESIHARMYPMVKKEKSVRTDNT